MATLNPPFAPPLYGRSAFDSMSDSEDSWQQQHYSQGAMLPQQWPSGYMLSGRQSLDINMYADDQYTNLNYIPNDNWSDYEASTPPTTGYAHEMSDPYVNALPAPSNHLQIPEKSRSRGNPMHSPHSSQGGMSPVHGTMPIALNTGLVTPPERERRSTDSSNSSISKAHPPSEEDADYFPNEDGRRGKKRQRIPHTAVERRYRENLNAHLEKLRQTVPTLASRNGSTKGSDRGEAAKPSKCEILNGAIEYIGSLDRENAALKNEVRALRTKMTEMDAWYRTNAR